MVRHADASLDELIQRHKVVVCVGSGGVGKTTTSAVLALHAALTGRKVIVLTIDPAKRLANSLGVSELDNEPRNIPLGEFAESLGLTSPTGELWAMMLDMKRSFDHLVDRYAPNAKTRDAIYANKFYRYFSTSLAGTQEFSAMERLYELYESGDYDLIVLDTPPTVHALDFLDAPTRLAEAVESSALQWIYKPSLAAGKFGFGLFNIGTNYVFKIIQRFTGGELLDELSVFLVNFSHMFDGFRSRARRVRQVLESSASIFFIVTSPDPITVDEARYFRSRLREESIPFGGFIVNRVHKGYVSRDELDAEADAVSDELAELAANAEGVDATDAELDALALGLLDNANAFQILADLDAQTLAALHERTGSEVQIVEVPFFSRDVHSFEGLNRVRGALFDAS